MNKQQFTEMLEKSGEHENYPFAYGVLKNILTSEYPPTPAKKVAEAKAFMEAFQEIMESRYPKS